MYLNCNLRNPFPKELADLQCCLLAREFAAKETFKNAVVVARAEGRMKMQMAVES